MGPKVAPFPQVAWRPALLPCGSAPPASVSPQHREQELLLLPHQTDSLRAGWGRGTLGFLPWASPGAALGAPRPGHPAAQ